MFDLNARFSRSNNEEDGKRRERTAQKEQTAVHTHSIRPFILGLYIINLGFSDLVRLANTSEHRQSKVSDLKRVTSVSAKIFADIVIFCDHLSRFKSDKDSFTYFFFQIHQKYIAPKIHAFIIFVN